MRNWNALIRPSPSSQAQIPRGSRGAFPIFSQVATHKEVISVGVAR